MTAPLKILVLGASYGLLPAIRIARSGHRVTIMCREGERQSLSSNGATVSFLRRDGQAGQVMSLPARTGEPQRQGELGLVGPEVDPAGFDLVFAALAEPQMAAPEIAQLIRRIADSRRPFVALMNLLPLPFLARIPGLDATSMQRAFTAPSVWDGMDPDLVTAASPDAQAVRIDPDHPERLTVTLASNFKIAPFARSSEQSLLERLADDVNGQRENGLPLPVRLIAHGSLHIPLVKWPMLLTGNCRSISADGQPRSIAEAVRGDLTESRRLYLMVCEILNKIGTAPEDIVPFAAYASAARYLARPSSLARALAAGTTQVERIDLMIACAARSVGLYVPEIDAVVASIETCIQRNSRAAVTRARRCS